MTTKALGPLAGIDWLKNAVNLGRHNPKAIFGGAVLLLVVLAAVLAAGALLQGVIIAASDGLVGMVVASLVFTVLLVVAMSMLLVGYLRLLDAVENRRPARATDVFAGFGDLPTSLRAIGLLLVLMILQYLLMAVLLSVFASDMLGWYMQMMQASTSGAAPPVVTSLPDGFGLGFTLVQLLGLVFYAVQAVGLGQLVLRRRSVLESLGDGFVGAFKNLLPLLVFALAVLVAAIVIGIAMFLLAMLVMLLAKALGMWVALVIGVPVYLVLLVVLVVVMFGVMYHLWRDVCGGDAPAADGEALSA